jgi:site-specific DNA-methyltransferase (adenine-specific)
MISHKLYQMDAIDLLRSIPDESVDLIVTDPPYESMEKWRKIGTTTRLKKQWFPIFKNEKFPELFPEMYRVLAPKSHLYLFCDQETMFTIKPMGEDAGFKFWKPLVFHKIPGIGMGYHYRAQYELILFFEKGKRKLNDLGVPDVIVGAPVRKGYPTEKPVSVIDVLIKQSTEMGEIVLDPFMGSGAVGVSATRLGRHFIGSDVLDNAVELAKERIGE